MAEPGIPVYETENRSRRNEYRISKTTLADPFRNVILQRVRFEALKAAASLRLWVVLAPALSNAAYGNNGWADSNANACVAARTGAALALKCSGGFVQMSCDYQGPRDGWSQLKSTGALQARNDRAHDGNILLVAELDALQSASGVTLALGFAELPHDAIREASESLAANFDDLVDAYAQEWRAQRRRCIPLRGVSTNRIYDASVAVLKCHTSKEQASGVVASLAAPWGETEQQNTDFRYQLSWTRDAVEAGTAFLALGDVDSAKSIWGFLAGTQRADGHWPQNMWLDGSAHWSGIQMDETALPILLADALRRHGQLRSSDAWPTVKRAASYLVVHGPRTEEDRWEQDGGYSPYTLAVEIAALLAAADFADDVGEYAVANYMRETADLWNDNIPEWTYSDGHYVRLSTPKTNRTGEIERMVVTGEKHSHSPAALALVRFGLRRADDPCLVQTIADLDRILKSDTATGPVWHRFPKDHYGEYDDGRPFDGDGVGRGWPLLLGERAHYEIARGNLDEARRLAAVMERQTSECGFIPEQVWDGSDLPERSLFSGRPTGSAMPLVWAHAEYVKLLRSLRDGRIFDMPPQTVDRYQNRGVRSRHAIWRTNHKTLTFASGKILRVESQEPATLYWTSDGWRTVQRVEASDSALGVFYCDLPTNALPAGGIVGFTLFWKARRIWENRAYELRVETR